MHVYEASEWKSPTGKWYVADTSDLGNDSAAWWIPAKIFNLSFEDYIDMLLNKYHATIDGWYPKSNNGKSLLLFSFVKYNDAHQYLLDVNRIARNKNWTI